MRDDRAAAELVELAALGDESAWKQIVRRYAPLIWAVCRRSGVTGTNADDIAATVWLRLVVHLPAIREPAALPGWLITTTWRACAGLLRGQNREYPNGDQESMDFDVDSSEEWLLDEERRIALRTAFADLSEQDQRLIALLFADPPASYAEISARLGIPHGTIGPTRRRCLARLRAHPAIAALLTVRG